MVPRLVSREDPANLVLQRGDPPHELLPRAARRTRLVLQRLQLRAQQLLGLLQRLRARTLLPQRLRTLGLVPDIGLFEFALNFGQAFSLSLVVKDTSSTHRSVRQGRQSFV